jgi:zinc transport system ATP-binding protein
MNKENKKILLKVENASFSKNNKWLVKGVSLELKQGEIVTLIGPNGSGKSTTAKIALGIYKNIEGKVNKFTNKIGYVPQKISIDWTLPIRVIDFMSLIEEPTDEQINIALNLTSVEHLRNKSLGDLSGGEFQRVMIARAIAKQPDLLVLDEPVQGVDFKGEITLYELIKKISEELNCGILLISHDLHVVMAATDFVVCLNGHVCCSGTPQVVAKNNEYKELFGDRASSILSLYEHKHDHTHSQDGTIKRKE